MIIITKKLFYIIVPISIIIFVLSINVYAGSYKSADGVEFTYSEAFSSSNSSGKIHVQIYDDANMENIVIPRNIEGLTVTEYSISGPDNDSIKTITFPDTIQKIYVAEADHYFKCMPKLENIYFKPKNPVYGCKNHVFYNKKTKKILEYIGNADLGNYTIPKYIKKIGKWAFWNQSNITSLKIGKNVSQIAWGAFCNNCPNLKKVVIPKSVKKIERGAFPKKCKIIKK